MTLEKQREALHSTALGNRIEAAMMTAVKALISQTTPSTPEKTVIRSILASPIAYVGQVVLLLVGTEEAISDNDLQTAVANALNDIVKVA